MSVKSFIVVCCLSVFIFSSSCTLPEESMNVTQLIRAQGYPCVDHTVVTADGYILSVQNIPGKGPPVYLQHGFLDSSATWVMNSKTQSLGFILADAGFDVWLGNTRGNVYCQAHTIVTNSSQLFWNFSWDQIARFDLPAKIDYILNVTKHTQLSYIGHSEGTLMGFAEFSSNNETASKVNIFIALAPIIYLANVGDLIKLGATTPNKTLIEEYGTMSFSEPWSENAQTLYALATEAPDVCEFAVCAVAGCEIGNLNKTRLPVYFSHFPAGSSVQNLLHYQQMVLYPTKWEMFNYGSTDDNTLHYGQSSPPIYSLSELTLPTALFYGTHDKFADAKDVQTLISQMPVPPYYQKEIRGYGHGDFVWGADAYQKLYPSVVYVLNQINQI